VKGKDGKVHLKALDVEGFRGANKKVHLDFSPRATVLSAWNGRGKSTLLGAIEWALFGELRFQPSENRTRDELVSLFHPAGRASVQVTLSRGSEDIRVSRTRVVGKMGSSLEVRDGSGQTLEGDEAADFIFRLTGLGFDDFYRAAFLHQDSIRGLLTEEQKDRDEALDRLLGVETIRNLLTSIPLRPVSTALDEIEDQEGRLMERLAGAGGVAEGTRSRAREEAIGAGYAEEELNLKKGLEETLALLADLRRACLKYDAEAPGEVTVENLEDLERAARRIKAATRAVRLTVGKESPLDVAVGRLGMLKKWRVEIETAQTDLQAAQTAVEEHGKEHGKPEQWAETRSSLLQAIERNEGALHVLDVHGKVVADAIAYLEAVPSSRECPVCGDPKEAAKLATLLRTKISKGQATEVRRLREEVTDAKGKIEGIAELETRRGRLVAESERCAASLKETLDTTWRDLGKKGTTGDPLATIKKEEVALNGKLQGLRNLNLEREGDLQKLDDGADRLRALQRFIKADSEFQRVREKAEGRDDRGAKAFEEDKKQLIALRSELESIIQALNGLSTGRAQEALARCGEDISRLYGSLCNHPYFDGLKIEVSQKAVQGVQRNTYRIIAYSSKDGQRTAASSRLSTAQMNCVALSAYLSLAKVLTHNLGFILLDDPSQNLDAEHKKALAGVIKGLFPSLQVVVGTHDAEFDEFLRSDLGREDVSWYDLNWNPRDGTSVIPGVANHG
jgi:DNA repair protein SbcC/Rad50